MKKKWMSPEELREHIDYFRNDPETIEIIGKSRLAKRVGILPTEREVIQTLIAIIITTMEDADLFPDPRGI